MIIRQVTFAAASWWLVASCWCCAVVKATGDQEESPEEQETQSQQQVAILKQINRVNDDGSYTFGYEAADGSFKIETRDVLGNVKGMFGFVDESGELKRVSYSASNKTGFQSGGNVPAVTEAEEKQDVSTQSPPLLYQQIIRPQVTTRRAPFAHDSPTTTRQPILLYAQSLTPAGVSETPETSTRSSVIQIIPKSRRPTEVSSSTATPIGSTTTRRPLQLYGQYIRQHPGSLRGEPVKQIFVTQAPVDETVQRADATSPRPTGLVYGHYLRPTQSVDNATPSGQLLRRTVLARRPPDVTPAAPLHFKQTQESKDSTEEGRTAKGNTLRRQLAQDRGQNYSPGLQIPPQVLRARQSRIDDAGDVYGGAIGGSPRPIAGIPFKPVFTPGQSRAVLQSHLLQDIAGTRERPGYPQDDIPPGAIPPAVDGAVRIPLGVIRGGALDPRIPPGAFQYAVPGYQYTPPGSDADLQEHLLQFLLGRQQPRQPTYVNDYQYRQQSPVPPLTPFQIALMMTLGENIPPELLDDPYQQVNRQQPPYGPQQPLYNRQNVPYPIPYPQQVPYVNPYPPQQGPYGQQIPYNQALPYDPQLYQQTYRGPVQYPSQIPYHIRRRLLYRPQPVYAQPLPYANDQSVPPEYYQQPLPYSGRNQQVGYPQDFLPDEYRDALILRMLLAVRAAQQQGRGQHRPVEQNPNIQERSQHYSATTTTTTVRPRTLGPVRNVQILDPVTEEATAKRSADVPSSRS